MNQTIDVKEIQRLWEMDMETLYGELGRQVVEDAGGLKDFIAAAKDWLSAKKERIANAVCPKYPEVRKAFESTSVDDIALAMLESVIQSAIGIGPIPALTVTVIVAKKGFDWLCKGRGDVEQS